MSELLELEKLVMEAKRLAGADPCAEGHAWESFGGRGCPRFGEGINCSQAVYACARCGAEDYGDPGGPAHTECYQECPNEWMMK